MPIERMLFIKDDDGTTVRSLDITGLDNSNSRKPLSVVIEVKCNLDYWHVEQYFKLNLWGSDKP